MKSRILIYDIETAPNLAYTWSKWVDGSVIALEQEWYILSFSYKWLGDKKIHVRALPDYSGYKKDPQSDKKLVQELHKLFDEADVIIAHNGNRFDQKKSQTRMLYHGFNPPAPYKQIDTLTVARKYFAFSSNRLDDLGEYLGVGRKIQTGGFGLWFGCIKGDPRAWNKMKRYNKQDVALLEKVYLKLRPWIVNHPSISLMEDRPDACPKCGGGPLLKMGSQWTKVGEYKVFRCKNCGGHPRFRVAEKTKKPTYVN